MRLTLRQRTNLVLPLFLGLAALLGQVVWPRSAWGQDLGELFVAKSADIAGQDSIMVYSRTASGNTAPIRTLAGAATLLSGPKDPSVDMVNNELVVPNSFGDSVTVYSRAASGNTAPIRTLTGAATGLRSPCALIVDTVNNELVVVNAGNQSVTVYPRTASGNTAPIRTLSGPATELSTQYPGNLVVDTVNNELVVGNTRSSSVTVYTRTATGNTAPIRTLAATAFAGFIDGIVVDTVNNELIVAGESGAIRSVNAYSRIASGNAAPIRTLAGAATGLTGPVALALDTVNDELEVANCCAPTSSITVYPRAASGDTAPIRTLAGPATGLDLPIGQLGPFLGLAVAAKPFNKQVVFTPGVLTTVAGTGAEGHSGDGGPATSATLFAPYGIRTDARGNLYIADRLSCYIRRVDTGGIITTVAGNGTCSFVGDGLPSGDGGTATSAALGSPQGLAIDAAGNLYIADFQNHRIRKVNPSGIISTVAGNGTSGFSGDGDIATKAQFFYPADVAVDASGNLFIADENNARVRKVNKNGIISTVAGNGVSGYGGDGGPATSAALSIPTGVAVDSAGNLYVADSAGQRVRKIDASGTISTFAGTGVSGGTIISDNVPAGAANLAYPTGVAPDNNGNVYIANYLGSLVSKVDSSGALTNVAGNGIAGFSQDGGSATASSLYLPWSVAADGFGNLYISETTGNRIRKLAVSNAALTFPSPPPQTVGSISAPLSVRMTNAGNAPLNFVGASFPPNFQAATVGNDCVPFATLAPGASCNIAVAFAPQTAGSLTGTLFVFDSALNSPQSVTLSGTAQLASFAVTVSKSGTGTGAVSSSPAGIDCGPTCSAMYANGTVISLTATPDASSQFTGWLGACTGMGTCSFNVSAAINVSATFAPATVMPRVDVDGNAGYDALTDGLLIIRYLSGLTGVALTNGVIGAGPTSPTPEEVLQHLDNIKPLLDVDGNGRVDPSTDGLMLVRYMMGLRGTALISGALGTGARRTTVPSIETYIQSLMP